MKFRSLLRNLLLSRRVDVDLDREILSHLEMLTEENIRAGMPLAEARRAARIELGGIEQVKEQVREKRIGNWLDSVLSDCRYCWRGLLRNPAFALTAVVSLSLAIGANTAIYSVVDAALLRPLPVAQPDRLFILTTSETIRPITLASNNEDTFSYPVYEQLCGAAGESASLALFDSPSRVEAQAAGLDGPYEQVIQQFVSPNTFEMLGIPPALGRLLSPSEDYYPAPRAVVVLSYDYWRRQFGADPSVLGRSLVLDGRTYSILGVARKGFSGTEPGKFVDVWLPVTLTDPAIFTNPSIRLFHLMGRLADGIGREQLAARLQPAFHHRQETSTEFEAEMPPDVQKRLREMNLLVRPGANGISAFRRTFSRPLWILLGVSVCMLVIACANVAGLVLARSTARSAEMALRVSLGARRARLIRQLLTDSLLISSVAGLCGWALASLAAPALLAMVSTKTDPVRLDLTLDTRALVFCAAICALSGLSFGLLSAWQATNSGPMLALRHGSGQVTRLGMSRPLVGAQVAFAFCLVTGGAGFLFTLRNLTTVDLGFDPRGVTVLTVNNTTLRDRQLAFMQQIQMRTAALPNVQGAATGWMPVFSGVRRAQRVVLPGQTPSEHEVTFYRVSPGYFATLHTGLLSGRDFTFSDNDNEPVPTIVNRAFARRYFESDSVLGRMFRRDDGVQHEIVGLAADSHFDDLRNGPEPIAYMPMKPPRAFTLYVRSTLDVGSVVKMVEREAEMVGPGIRVSDATTVEGLVQSTMTNERLLASIGGAFAFLGLVLAATGLFGLLNYSVTRRTKEIGIRTAMGAQRTAIYSLVLRDMLGLMAGGLAVGLVASYVLMRLTQSMLFGVRPADPVVISTSIAVFIVTALVAGGLPARRAACVDPVTALRSE
ncbi:MAG: ADOP family duplicated permease [Candidatus Acidiferrum sp.]